MDSEDDSAHSEAVDDGHEDNNASNVSDADATSTSDKENAPPTPSTAYVAKLEAELEALKGELASAKKLRAEEMNATRRTQARLYEFVAQVQGIHEDAVLVADSMIVRNV